MPKINIPNPLEIWNAITPEAKRMLRWMVFLGFICFCSMIMWAFFSGEITLYEAIDLIRELFGLDVSHTIDDFDGQSLGNIK